jgi:hypothetical protein
MGAPKTLRIGSGRLMPSPTGGILLVFAILIMSGCFSQSPHSPTASPASGHESPTSEDDGLDLPKTSPAAEMSVALNVTNCEAHGASGLLPGLFAKSQLPPNYTLAYAGGEGAFVMLQMARCEKVAIDGADRGNASLQMLTLAVQNPTGAPPADDATTRYLVEIRTDNGALAEWLANQGVAVETGTVEQTFETLNSDFLIMKMDGAVREADGVLYETEGVSYDIMLDEQYFDRVFFGPDPRRDFLDFVVREEGNGPGPGLVTMADGTTLSEMVGGANTVYLNMWMFNVMSAVVTPGSGTS